MKFPHVKIVIFPPPTNWQLPWLSIADETQIKHSANSLILLADQLSEFLHRDRQNNHFGPHKCFAMIIHNDNNDFKDNRLYSFI